MAGRCRCESTGVTGCSANGSNCVAITGIGTAANPFVVAPIISPAAGQILQCLPTGLYAEAPADRLRIFAVDGTLVNPPPDPATFGDWKIIAESNVSISAAGGFADVPFPTPFPNGLLTVTVALGDRMPVAGANIAIDNVQTTLSHFVVVTTDSAGVGVDGAVRLNYVAVGW